MNRYLFLVCILVALGLVVWWLLWKGALDVVMVLLIVALVCVGLWSFAQWLS